MCIKFSFISKAAINNLDAADKVPPSVYDEMVEQAGYIPSKILYIQTGIQDVPTTLLLSELKKAFKEGFVFANGSVEVWNGSFHACDYFTVGKPGDFVIYFPKRKVKHVFSRAKRAVSQAKKAWGTVQQEATRNFLVRKGVWRREGD